MTLVVRYRITRATLPQVLETLKALTKIQKEGVEPLSSGEDPKYREVIDMFVCCQGALGFNVTLSTSFPQQFTERPVRTCAFKGNALKPEV